MWALFEEAVGAQTVAKIEVLPWGALSRGATGDRVSVDEHLDRAHVASEIASVVVRLCQRRRRDARIVLSRFRRTVPKPGERCPSQACSSKSVIGSLAL